MSKQLFDSTGRRIVPEKLNAKVGKPDKYVMLEQPGINSFVRLYRIHEYLGKTTCTANQFQTEAEKIKETAMADERISDMFKGVHLPILIPKTEITDIGSIMEKYLEAVSSLRTPF